MSIHSLPAKRSTFLLLRLIPSVALLALLAGLIGLAWFPGIYFDLSGVGKRVLVLTAVVLVIGPGLSTLVYRPGKRGLYMDLTLIFVVELLAFAYFGNMLYQRQPQTLVFAIDRFQIVEAGDIADYPYRFPELAGRTLYEPRLVSAQFPEVQSERAVLKRQILREGHPDIDIRPDHWYPYDQAIPAVLEVARPLAELRRRSEDHAKAVDRWLEGQTGASRDYVFLPMAGTARDATAVLGAGDGQLLDILDLDPWE
jgi:hypothetical protein